MKYIALNKPIGNIPLLILKALEDPRGFLDPHEEH